MENIIKKIKPASESMKGIVRNPIRRKAMLLALVASTNLALSGCGKTNNPTLREVAEENNKITYMDELLDDENDMVGIYEGSQLVYLSFGEAIDLLENRIDLINRLEKSKVKKYDATNNQNTEDNLKKVTYEEAIVLIDKFKNANKEEKEKLGPQLSYLSNYYKVFIKENGLALIESLLKRTIKGTVAFSLNYDSKEYDVFIISREEEESNPSVSDENGNNYTISGDLQKACNYLYRVQQLRKQEILDSSEVIELVEEIMKLCESIVVKRYYCDGNNVKCAK